jgi:dTDP-glucose 4,6-dehydratase
VLPVEDLDAAVDAVGESWEELRGARVLVTGGTGFFGVWVIGTLLRANERLGLGARAVVWSRRPGTLVADVEVAAGDVRDLEPSSVEPCSHVMHLATAAVAAGAAEQPFLTFDTAVTGTQRALDAAAAWGTRGFLLASSGAVYGHQPTGLDRVGEDFPGGPDPTGPAAAYAEGKRAAETLAAIAARAGLRATIARGFAFVGPHLPLEGGYAAGNFVRDALAGGPIRVGGDGTPLRSYLYASDLAAWLWTILLRGQAGRAYNVGSERAVSIVDLARAVAAEAGGCAVEVAGEPRPGVPPERYVPSTQRARDELDLHETVELEDAIRRTLAWHRAAR